MLSRRSSLDGKGDQVGDLLIHDHLHIIMENDLLKLKTYNLHIYIYKKDNLKTKSPLLLLTTLIY